MNAPEVSTAYGRALVHDHLSQFDLVFSAGPSCRCAFHLRRLFNQEEAFPFDWWLTPASSVAQMLRPDYRFELKPKDIHLTHASQVVFNSRDLILHLHDFNRTANGEISLEQLDDQLEKVNAKYSFLFERLRTRLRQAKRCLVIFEGLMPAHHLEKYRERTDCPALIYPDLPPTFAPELAAMMKEDYNVEPFLVCLGLGAPAIESQPDLLQITVPQLRSSFDDASEAWQHPWASYDMFIAMLCAAVSA